MIVVVQLVVTAPVEMVIVTGPRRAVATTTMIVVGMAVLPQEFVVRSMIIHHLVVVVLMIRIVAITHPLILTSTAMVDQDTIARLQENIREMVAILLGTMTVVVTSNCPSKWLIGSPYDIR